MDDWIVTGYASMTYGERRFSSATALCQIDTVVWTRPSDLSGQNYTLPNCPQRAGGRKSRPFSSGEPQKRLSRRFCSDPPAN